MADETGLRDKLARFSFDDPQASLPFSARLARDMCWPQDFTSRAIEEYRRFLYLACSAGHIVTPSEEVDAVWHMHMTYTRSYWQALCRDTLGRELHHQPTEGGLAETAKYRALYAQTLASYRRAFGEEPPCDIWPDTDARFARKKVRPVDTQAYWVIPKRPFQLLARTFGAKALFAGAIAASTGAAYAASGGDEWLGIPFGVWLIFIAVPAVLAIKFFQRAGKARRSPRRGRTRDSYYDHTHSDAFSSTPSRDDRPGETSSSDGGKGGPASGSSSPAMGTAAALATGAVVGGVAGAAIAASQAQAKDGQPTTEPSNPPVETGGADSGSGSSGGWFGGLFGGWGDSSSDSSGDSSSDSGGGDSGCGGGCGGGD
ncbi:MAG: hypothetical protein AB7F96_08165 [Beijerinckiaceae bacterium]